MSSTATVTRYGVRDGETFEQYKARIRFAFSSSDERPAGMPSDADLLRRYESSTTEAGATEGHTATPWQSANNWIMRRQPTCDIHIAACDAYTIPKGLSDPRDKANAQYIVECVNAHASLVAEVGRLRETLEGIRTWLIAPALDKQTLDVVRKGIAAALRSGGE